MEDNKSISSEAPHLCAEEVVAHSGVAKIKATHKVYGKYSKWFLFVGVHLFSRWSDNLGGPCIRGVFFEQPQSY